MVDLPIGVFFAQVALILLACRAVGLVAARVGQPQVMAEMVAGFLIGPSLFGWLAPDLQAQIFPAASRPALYVVSQIGLVLYMFCVGLEFRSELMLRHARRAAAVSIAGIAGPLLLGGALAVVLMRSGGFFAAGVRPFHAILFVGAALSITAFPVLARIIAERGIAGTAMGSLALAAGALNDAAAWVILAIVLGSFTGNATLALVAALGGLVYTVVVFSAGRRLFTWFAAMADDQGGVPPWMFTLVLALLAAGAWFTDRVGIHAVFGAFVIGAATPAGRLSRELQARIEPLTTAFLVPLFFVYSGLNSSIGLVDSAWLWMVAGLAFLAACAGKGVACFIAARVTGATTREALSIATLMNARGLMELILLNIGLQRGLITPTLFTILVMMTIATTLMAGPLFGFINRHEPVPLRDRDLRVGEGA
ncbi:MAG: cation:proton antiporter [Vicinamibacterales bacterium]